MKQHFDTLSLNDSNYEAVLQSFIKASKKEKNDVLLFDGYLNAAEYYEDTFKRNIYLDSAWVVVNKLRENTYKVKFYQTKGYIYFIDKKYPESLHNQLLALELIDRDIEPYLYHKALYSIGAVQLYMNNYEEALINFNKGKLYFKSFKNNSHIYGYFNALRSEAICYYYLNDFAKVEKLLNEAETHFYLLNTEYQTLEKAYFNLTKGMVFYQQKKYVASVELLESSLKEIVLNDDFANEYLIYFYLGKNYWALNDKKLAVFYFKKIDELFNTKGYINVHFLEAYRFLIEDAQANNDLKAELYFTSRLLEATEVFRSTQTYLSEYLFKNFDTKQLKAQKAELEEQIAQKHLFLIGACVAAIVLLLGVFFIYVRNLRLRKKYKNNYNLLLKQFEDQKSNQIDGTINEEWKKISLNNTWQSYVHSNNFNSEENDLKKEPLPSVLIDDLTSKLMCFEENKLFLSSDISLTDVAEYCKTNRSYLSQYINNIKGCSFPDYINALRIRLLLEDLQSDLQLKRYKTDVIAERYGYSNRRSFSNAFLKITGISYSFYLNELQKKL